jgi:hypothetical protein
MLILSSVLPHVQRDATPSNLLEFLQQVGRLAVHDVAVRETIEQPTFKQLVPKLARTFKMSEKEFLGYDSAHHQLPMPKSPTVTNFLCVLTRCTQIDLMDEARNLLAVGLPTWPDSISTFWSKWPVVLNFYRSLVDLMCGARNMAIIGTITKSVPEVIQKASQYLITTQPTPPRDWCLPFNRPYHSCHNGPCKRVTEFLMNPVEPIATLTWAETTLRHIQDSFSGSQDFEFERVQHGLVIRKTNKEYTRKMQTWQTNVRDLRAQWEGLRERFADDMFNCPPTKIRELDELLATAVVGGNNAFAARPLPTPTCAGPTMIAPPAPTTMRPLPAHTFSAPTMTAPTAAATTRPLRGLSAWAQNAAIPGISTRA